MNFPSRSLWNISFTHVLVADGHVKTRLHMHLHKHIHTYNRTTQASFVSLSQGKRNTAPASFCVMFPVTFRTHTHTPPAARHLVSVVATSKLLTFRSTRTWFSVFRKMERKVHELLMELKIN